MNATRSPILRLVRPVLIACLLLPAHQARASEVALVGDTLTIHAEGTPLQDVLKQFCSAGVRVKIDPRINPKVTLHIENKDTRKAVERLVKPHDYAILWDVVQTPLGTITRLAEIQVFMAGAKDRMSPLRGPDNPPSTPRPGVNAPLFAPGEILLGFKAGADMESFKRLLSEVGGAFVECVPELGVYRIRLPPGANVPALVERLRKHPLVSVAEPNYLYRAPTPVRFGQVSPSALLPAAALPVSASSAPVAVLDSGTAPHLPALDAATLARLDAVNPEQPLDDTQGHGTQMALIASGLVTPDGVATSGPPGAVPLIPVRAFDEGGYASSYSILRSIAFAVGNGARVLSMSWGSPQKSEFLENAIAFAASKGMIPVAAVGNEPTGEPMYPAAYPGVLGVSALLPDGSVWTNSNYGDFVVLAAPGLARMPVGYRGPPGMYAGTSIATAYAAHTLARYLALYPEASPGQAVSALTNSLSLTARERDPRIGMGILDDRAVSAFLATPP